MMLSKKIKLTATAAACMGMSTGAFAATPNVAELAAHPQCYAASGTVYVRGAIAAVENGAPIPGARIKLAYGGATRYATTDTSGVYLAEFPQSAGRAVHEVSTTIAAPTGTLIPVEAREGGSSCMVPVAHVGELRELEGRRVKQ